MYKKYFLSFLLIFSINIISAQMLTTNQVSEDIKLAQQGQAEAQYRLGFWYLIGKDVPQDHQEAFHWFMRAAKQGHKDAQYNVAWMYLEGTGVERDEKQATDLFKILAKQGDAGAQYQLGEIYSSLTNDLSYEEAERILDEAELNSLSVSETYTLLEGNGKVQSQAFNWYEKAAEQGHAEAQYTVIQYLRLNPEFSGDGELVAFWYRESAEQGHLESQCELAWMYFNGEGITQNFKEAFYWGEKAAKQDGICGRFFLVNMYQEEPVIDIILAYTWLIVDENSSSPFFTEKAKVELSALLSSNQVLKAEQDAQNLIYEINQNKQNDKNSIEYLLSSDEIVEIPRLSHELFNEIYNYNEKMEGFYGTVDAH